MYIRPNGPNCQEGNVRFCTKYLLRSVGGGHPHDSQSMLAALSLIIRHKPTKRGSSKLDIGGDVSGDFSTY
ncbi:hypothetical protein vBBaMIFTN8_35 [Bordetella phage vB_BaM-IFTN8]|nr:hypothetical protein vBBaMIFTN8_35 [Bordetella phage vB_BaM-IFTN8]